jgi:hypothetical protein
LVAERVDLVGGHSLTTLQHRKFDWGLSGYDFAVACPGVVDLIALLDSRAYPVTVVTENHASFLCCTLCKSHGDEAESPLDAAASCSPLCNTASFLTLTRGDGGHTQLLGGRCCYLVQLFHFLPAHAFGSLLVISIEP